MAYKEELTLKAKGLHTYSDSLASVPEGSLRIASNVVLDKDDIISPRRGYETLPGSISGDISSLHSYTDSQDSNTLIAHRDGTTLSRYDDGSETWIDYSGTYGVHASANVIRSAESNKNLYFATDKGVQKLDSKTSTPIDSGAPQALDLLLDSEVGGPGGVIPDDSSAGYRVVWGYKDLNDNLILGAPSARLIYENSSGQAQEPTFKVTIPSPPVDEIWFVQLYRTITSTGASSDPGDNMQLALERNPDATDLSNGYINLTDQTPDELLGAALYTNANQEGIINANFTPPQCVDMALYQNHMFYANTESKYEFTLNMLAKPTAGDTITVNSVVYTAVAAAPAANEYIIGTSGTVAQQIEETCRNLVETINFSASNSTLWAVYDSQEDELPGKMRYYERDYGDAIDFTVEASNGASYTPDITTAQDSTNNKNPNRVYYSKIQEPEAVPLLNFFDIGPANDRILRILPLRSTLLVFTTTAIYRMTGTTSATFQVTLLDNTAKLLAPESLVSVNNTAMGFFDQGVVKVSSSAVQIISRPIEGDLLTIRGAAKEKLEELSFGISYESDRKYLLAIPTTDTATSNSIFYVYNTVTNSWTTYDLQKSAGIVRPSDDKLYLAETGKVSRERKDYTSTDFSEEAIEVTATQVSLDLLTITLDTIAGVLEGYIYYESAGKYSVIQSVDTINSTITVTDPLDWELVAAEVRPYISTTIVWNPITANSPNLLKQFAECTLIVETPLQDAMLEFSTPTSGGFEGINIKDTSVGPWGLFPWEGVAWGGEPIRTRYRTYVPRNKQKDTFITTKLSQNTVFNDFQISGLSYYFRPISNRVGR